MLPEAVSSEVSVEWSDGVIQRTSKSGCRMS